MLSHLGFPLEPQPPLFPQGMTDEFACGGYATTLTFVLSHAVSALALAPTGLLGWEGCGAVGRSLFVLGTLSDLGFSLYDFVKTSLRVWAPRYFERRTGQPAFPREYWFVVCAFHHPFAAALVVPLNLYNPSYRPYHVLALAFYADIAVCYGCRQWQATLDLETPRGRRLDRLATVGSAVTMHITRLGLWSAQIRRAILAFAANPSPWWLRVGVPTAALLTVFNLTLCAEQLSQVTWPRGRMAAWPRGRVAAWLPHGHV